MNEGCEARFPYDMLQKALDEDNLQKLEEKRRHQALNIADIEGLEMCKYCNYPIIFDVPPDVNKVFKCGNADCGREYCRKCQVDWDEHIGRPCKEVETEDDTKKRREAEERMAAAVIRRCSKCKSPMIKEEGCNKLTCQCGAIMCYICRQTITGYDHFCQHVREPGKQCQACKNCSLWEDAKIKDSAAVREIQAEAKKDLAEAGKDLKIGVEEAAVAPKLNQQAAAAAAVHAGGPIQFLEAARHQQDWVDLERRHREHHQRRQQLQQQLQQNRQQNLQRLQNAVVANGAAPIAPNYLAPPNQPPAQGQNPPIAVADHRPPQAANDIAPPIQPAQQFPPPVPGDYRLAPHGGARPRNYPPPQPVQPIHHGGARPRNYAAPLPADRQPPRPARQDGAGPAHNPPLPAQNRQNVPAHAYALMPENHRPANQRPVVEYGDLELEMEPN